MYKIVHIARVVWNRLELILVIGTIIVGLSLLGGFVAHQVIDWKQSQSEAELEGINKELNR